MKPKALLLFALLMGGFLLLSGCLYASPRDWSGPEVADDTLYVGTIGGRVIRYVLLSDPEPLAVEQGHYDIAVGGGGGFLSCAPATPAGTYSTPFVADGVVYIGAYNGQVYAIDAVNMTKIWAYPVESYIGSIVGSPVVADGILYIGSSDGNLYAIDIETRRLAWGFPFETGDDIWATPLVHDGVVYIGSFDHRLYALNATDGTPVWESPFQTDGAIAATPLIDNDTIYIGSLDRTFYAVNASTGEVKEGFTPFQAGNWFWGQAVAYDDTIIVGCLDGRVYALDAETGARKWSFPEPDKGTVGAIRGDPALVGDLVIFGSEDGKVYALDAGTGAERWRRNLEEPPTQVRASLCAGEGVVYVHATNQRIYALETEHGDVLWSVSTGE